MSIPFPRRFDFDRRVDKAALMARELKLLRSLKRAVPPRAPLAQPRPDLDKGDPKKCR